jgi:D-beta-D-heptose 7-phosphate kinase/D-beta-D-heptose 1-phosphate adenosyltransferase
LKGPSRPIQTVTDRARVLEAIRHVDAVAVFDEDTPVQLLRTIRPDIWVKGGDYTGAELPETELLRQWGGQVVTAPYLGGRSTTALTELARR